MMLFRTSTLALGCSGLLLAAGLASGQTLPAAAPTSAPHPQELPAAPQKLSQQPAEPATIQLTGGRLTVVAENSSLNQILHEIADDTGMKITGGVSEERVFGSYGPATVGAVLNLLLEGTGSNMMLVEGAGDLPRELVLTPRNGGATPPSPMAESYRRPDRGRGRDRERDAGPRIAPSIAPIVAPSIAPVAAPPGNLPAPVTTPSTQQSPNGVKTPEQYYEQLLKMQQQQQQQPKPGTGTPPA